MRKTKTTSPQKKREKTSKKRRKGMRHIVIN